MDANRWRLSAARGFSRTFSDSSGVRANCGSSFTSIWYDVHVTATDCYWCFSLPPVCEKAKPDENGPYLYLRLGWMLTLFPSYLSHATLLAQWRKSKFVLRVIVALEVFGPYLFGLQVISKTNLTSFQRVGFCDFLELVFVFLIYRRRYINHYQK